MAALRVGNKNYPLVLTFIFFAQKQFNYCSGYQVNQYPQNTVTLEKSIQSEKYFQNLNFFSIIFFKIFVECSNIITL